VPLDDQLRIAIQQLLRLCKSHRLYSAYIYMYNRALNDYVTPALELIEVRATPHAYSLFPRCY